MTNAIRVGIVLFLFLISTTNTSAQVMNEQDFSKLASDEFLSQQGLQNLSSSEKQIVRSLLFNAYSLGMENLLQAAQNTAPIPPQTMSPCPVGNRAVNSRITGDFEGWEGESIYQLDNGQIWQQSEYKYKYKYKYAPKVNLFRSGSSWNMLVEGMDEPIKVRCIN